MSTSSIPTPTAGPSRPPRRRHLRRVAAAVGAAALTAPFVLGVGALGASAVGPASAGASLTATPGIVQAADRGGYGPFGGYAYGGASGYAYGYGGGQGDSGLSGLPGGTTSTSLDTSDATEEQSVGLALITSTLDYGAGEAAGTGMVIDADGLVVTNHHVVADATSLEVTIAETGETFEATYVGGDATRDVAVLRLTGATELTPVDLDPTGVAEGDVVTSIGDAGGDGGSLTAASGTVTDARTGIEVSNDDGSTSRLRALIEVDADIVPGDSGGALLDADGEVAGMNVAASGGGTDITGYAIPITRVLRITEAIIDGDTSNGVVLGYEAFLGVELSGAGTSPVLAGVLDGTAAATAGLAAGDTVTAVGDITVTTADELSSAIATHAAGETVSIAWTDSDGADHEAEATLGAAPIA